MDRVVVRDVHDALALLVRLGAPPRLVRHHELVVEAAREIIDGLGGLASGFDSHVVLLGASVHDAGKILHRGEMDGPGDRHEVDGRMLLLEHGLAELARFAVTHARWSDDNARLEDLIVALADKLWKGKRVAELERRVVERLAESSGQAFWDVFVVADGAFERVASGADERLARSVSAGC